MIRLDAVSLGEAPPDEINVVITLPCGSAPAAVETGPDGILQVVRLYQTAMQAPGALGLIPQTRREAGGALGAFLPLDGALPAGLVVSCRPVGVVFVTGPESDVETVLAVPVRQVTPRFERIKTYTDLPGAQLRQLSHYLCHMQDLEDDQEMRSAAWGDVNEAHRVIEEAAERAPARSPLVT